MLTQRSTQKTVNMAPPGGLFASEQRCDDNSESPDESSRHATRIDSQFGILTNQYHPPHGYCYPPAQQPFPGTPQLYHQSPFNMTHSSQPTSGTSQGYPGYGPPWQGYDLHQGGYARCQMFPSPQFPGQGPSSPGAPRVTSGPPGNHPINLPTSSSSTPPPQPPSGAPGRHPISLPTTRFQPPAEPPKTDDAGIADLPPLPELSYDEYDAAEVVLATGLGNRPAVRVWTGKTVRFGSRPVQNHDWELLGGPNPYPYPLTRGFRRVWLDPSVPVSGSPFRVFLFMVAVIYVTVMCRILTLVHHSLYWFHWQPLNSKQGETCSLLHPEVECDQVFIFHHL